MNKEEISDLLRSCELFNDLDKKEINKVMALCSIKTYKKGENIFCQGDRCGDLSIIAKGSVFLERTINVGKRKGRATICILGKGRAFGCWSTLLGQSHNIMSSALCQQPTKVVVINGFKLREMMTADYKLGFNVLQGLCFMLRDRIQGAYGALENI